MPRKHRPRDTKIYVPATPQAAQPGSPSEQPDGPSLEVLLMAQQIAHQRGHTFDIESFLTPEQRAEYAALQGEDPDPPSTGTSDRSAGAGSASGEGNTSHQDGGAEGGSTRERDEIEDLSTPPAKRIKLGPNTPLSQVYWKQRFDQLARVRSRSFSPSSSPANSTHHAHDHPPSPARSREASPSPWARRELRDTPVHLRKLAPVTEADKVDIAASASYWNHLLCQARAARGPQYDYNTRQLLFDRQSEAYYTQGKPPRGDTPPPEPQPEPEKDKEGGKDKSDSKEKDKAEAGKEKEKDKGKEVEKGGEDGGDKAKESKETPKVNGGEPPQPNGTPKSNTSQPPPSPGQGPPGPGGPGGPGGPQVRLAAAQAAQANVQAQALSLGGVGPPGQESPGGPGGHGGPVGMPPGTMNPGINPGMMQMPQGVNPMALMGGGPPPQGPMVGGGQGPMLGGGWQDD